MPMSAAQTNSPLDARLLSDAIIEINITRHKAAIYPAGHPVVEDSLNRSFAFIQKLLELRLELRLSVAKDTLIVDDGALEKNNPLYREFALCLSSKNIASVTLLRGLAKEELYAFHQFLSKDVGESSPEEIEEEFKTCALPHVKADFIDYGAFSFVEGATGEGASQEYIWERYVKELIRGTLQTGHYSVIRQIPVEVFARLVDETATDTLPEETYDRIIASYLSRSSGKASWSVDLGMLLKFINRLRPELKRQFLSSSLKSFPKTIDSLEEIIQDIPADEAIELLNAINDQQVAIPEAIKNLLEKLSLLTPESREGRRSGDELIVDDIPLALDITAMLSEDDFKTFVTDAYSRELQALLAFDASGLSVQESQELRKEWGDEVIEKDFNQTLLELIASDRENLITQNNFDYFNGLLKDQIEQFIGTGQYDQVLRIVSVLKSDAAKKRMSQMDLDIASPETASLLVDSFRIVGSQNREDALLLCEHFGEKLAAPLVNALINEESRKIRRFLLDLIIHLGDGAVPEVIKHLSDTRWYVKRNMLFILSEASSRETLPHVRPYCYHENLKICFHAIKYMLKADANYGIEVLRNYLRSGITHKVEMALMMAGGFGLKALVPELLGMLKKMAKRGSDFDHKIPVVKALGQIGDPRALDTLKTVLEAKSLLFKGPLTRLKEEVLSTLKNYPSNDVKEVMGARACNPESVSRKAHAGA